MAEEIPRERAYDIFNDLNSDDDFEVHCRDEGRTGTRSTQRVCRPRFESRISRATAQEYLAMLSWSGTGDAVTGFIDTQKCMFNGVGPRATANAQGVESQALSRREEMFGERCYCSGWKRKPGSAFRLILPGIWKLTSSDT